MGDGEFHIETMNREELETVLHWARHEGWQTGLNDADAFYHIDPEGLFIGKIGDELIGSVGGLVYDKLYAFMGLYMVKEAWRGKRYGKALWDAAMMRLDGMGVKIVGLDGVHEMLLQYEAEGFRPAYDHVRWRYEVNGSEKLLPTVFNASEKDWNAIAAYESQYELELRQGFTARWLNIPASWSMYWADHQHGEIKGYGAVRECPGGYRVGPLYAHDVTVATELFEGLCTQANSGGHMFLDVPDVNKVAIRVAENRGMEKVGSFMRMYRGGIPSVAIDQIFSVRSVEVG
ncbi:GNAT family N-acetyltransferase [Poriferisphaera sp. WC338]|uniref:GNAT family N-acetyltransferase n=1 Tax=Poriferisphaera sp. WC338 TaxID=3425129 RepID=UPI003D813E74